MKDLSPPDAWIDMSWKHDSLHLDASFTVQRLRDLPFAGHIRDYEYLEEKSMHHHQETTRERQDGAWILFLTASPKNSSLGVRTCC